MLKSYEEWKKLREGIIGGTLGAVGGGLLGAPFGPIGSALGGAIGSKAGSFAGDFVGGEVGWTPAKDILNACHKTDDGFVDLIVAMQEGKKRGWVTDANLQQARQLHRGLSALVRQLEKKIRPGTLEQVVGVSSDDVAGGADD